MDSSADMNLVPYFIGLAVCIMLITYIYEKKRTEALKLTAKNLRFTFSKAGRGLTEHKHRNFELFSKGHGKKVKNEMWGSRRGMDVSIFGYYYTVGYGKNANKYSQTVVSMDCNKIKFPAFELKPENTFHKIGQVFGYQDIDFETFPSFSKEYLLRGEDETRIRQLFTARVIRFFESNKNLCIEAHNNTLIFYKPSKRCKPEDIEDFVEEGQRVQRVFS